MEEKSNVSRFTVSLSTEGNNALNAIMALTNRNPNREKSNVIDEAIQFYFSYLSGQLNMDWEKMTEVRQTPRVKRLLGIAQRRAEEQERVPKTVEEFAAMMKNEQEKEQSFELEL